MRPGCVFPYPCTVQNQRNVRVRTFFEKKIKNDRVSFLGLGLGLVLGLVLAMCFFSGSVLYKGMEIRVPVTGRHAVERERERERET